VQLCPAVCVVHRPLCISGWQACAQVQPYGVCKGGAYEACVAAVHATAMQRHRAFALGMIRAWANICQNPEVRCCNGERASFSFAFLCGVDRGFKSRYTPAPHPPTPNPPLHQGSMRDATPTVLGHVNCASCKVHLGLFEAMGENAPGVVAAGEWCGLCDSGCYRKSAAS
jgi:hypothetical protein